MIKLPYGISNFETLAKDDFYFVDRTDYIEQLEQFGSRYLFFLRPRRFGKSLFISMLEHYYGVQHKSQFEQIFGQYYIGQQSTKLVNQFLILKFDFSQIDTATFESTYQGFLNNVKQGVLSFIGSYAQYFNEQSEEEIGNAKTPEGTLQTLLRIFNLKRKDQKIYLLIDEYDHFANEILSFRFNDFIKMVGQNGFVRKFYEAIKVGTHSGAIDRLFVTGVSPITLDSLTSGFNIATNVSIYEEFNAMMGFKEEEVKDILKGIEVPNHQLDGTLDLMRNWYNGYLFSKRGIEKVYNSDMVLYFGLEYGRNQEIPEELLDINIASDYSKIRKLFKIKNQEEKHLVYLEELLLTGTLQSELIRLFELERGFDRADFISLLYYMGILTIAGSELKELIFRMPNYVIKELYYEYFYHIILERSQIEIHGVDLTAKVKDLGFRNNIQPLVEFTQSVLTELSNRDKMNFDEKYIKAIFTSIFFTVGVYNIHNEFEVKKSTTEKGYVDLLLVERPPLKLDYQFAIEIKYLKKAEANRAEEVKQEAVQQLKNYLQHDDYLKGLEELKAYVVLFVGNEGRFEEVLL
ncbi:MAG: AAA family ATPase [Bacteroidota bacterium]